MRNHLLYRKILYTFLSLMIVISSTQSAYATTSVGGWTATDSLIAGSNTTINAAKTAGGKALKSSITVAASASKVGKHLIKGGGQAALAYAVVELLGEGIDWVLDPANNAVTYTDPDAPTTGVPVGKYYYVNQFDPYSTKFDQFIFACNNPVAVANLGEGSYVIKNIGVCIYWSTGNYRDVTIPISQIENPAYDPDAPTYDNKKSIPIDVVAAKVIANAEAGHAPSQEAVKATALEGFAAGEHDAALDAAATEVGTENPPDTDNPPVTDPAVPFDPSSIIAAINSLKALLAGILSSITDFSDWWKSQWTTFSTAITDFNTWVRTEPAASTLEPEPVDVSDGAIIDGFEDKANAGYVNMGNTQCPADVLIPISYMGASTNLSLSYVPFCHFASIIRYAVILGAWVAALMIISGGRTKE